MSAIDVKVPDIGDFHDIPVIEVLVKPGDTVHKDDALLTLESDKATLEIPSPAAGVVANIAVKVGDKVSQGSVVMQLEAEAAPVAVAATSAAAAGISAPTPPAAAAVSESVESRKESGPGAEAPESTPSQAAGTPLATASAPAAPPAVETYPPDRLASGSGSGAATSPAGDDEAGFRKAHASPGVRAFARELGVDLGRVQGSGPKARILREDIQNFVKQSLAGAVSAVGAPASSASESGLNLLAWPKVDFEKFGAVERRPLSRIRKLSGANLARNWVMIPHV
ncbi:MAG: biotin/lipoyl-containing protein, partial [Caldimonas sp.]